MVKPKPVGLHASKLLSELIKNGCDVGFSRSQTLRLIEGALRSYHRQRHAHYVKSQNKLYKPVAK